MSDFRFCSDYHDDYFSTLIILDTGDRDLVDSLREPEDAWPGELSDSADDVSDADDGSDVGFIIIASNDDNAQQADDDAASDRGSSPSATGITVASQQVSNVVNASIEVSCNLSVS